ncbi:alkylation response protein AidB-like acyl-CoA dehydrogenase [Chromohalobacter marismortui]|uniref:3-methylmercaptopropionyl-CoA dehydrogenase n=1 Tax=Chromohalobacter marismortui TaxID=42055 RepID=A0A4R7NL99_9GAMM|nr:MULTISPECIES: acyl-CoA dehydrogenase [Chromohalobacter]MCI0510130.1 acyl-CoA dehydrogenase [Chromohalobacter sp.]MCI0594841.1 acyl-CoA dehydrogenase [Chromohalobacter sp.]TDU21545.1 alkylation response protein AidB-like acyl-CoA dehydrogenase [Chromohalobacter marismortui]
MSSYNAPLRDLRFLLEELLDHRSLRLPEYQEVSAELVTAILDEAARLAGEVWAPLNRRGDEQGCRLEAGEVRAPTGFAEAYRAFAEGGWNGIGSDPDHGGQGLPEVVASAVQEMWQAANMALALCPLLTAGAVEALAQHGSEELKSRYLEKLVSGEWTGTMNLTEPQAGSDLSKVRTRAVPEGAHYRLNGQKIFITWGEHDCADNIIHLVLARLPDAAEGNRGISLFLVPKFLVDEQGHLGERNDVRCVSLEHKLGIHGSPTCALSFGEQDGAIGYLVGEPGHGLQHMFTMMNAARHKVGIQGIGVAERAYQQARTYAMQRVQGRTPAARGGRPAVLSEHYEVRRMLLSMRARLEALRALALLSASEMDRARYAPTVDERQGAQRRVDLYTPVVKAFSTDQAVDIASLGVQVHGGMGYMEETGAAQHLRDARIAPIYEGTNGIQALDLAGRKIQRDGGATLGGVLDEVAACAVDLTANAKLAGLGASLHQGVEDLRRAVAIVLARGDDAEHGHDALQALATPLLALTGHVLCAWQMGRAALIAQTALASGDDEAFYRAKLISADFVLRQWLPMGRAHLAAIEASPSLFEAPV